MLAIIAFQVADINQVQAFRGHEKQYMRLASAWSVVFLIAMGVSFFAKAGDQFSRAWLAASTSSAARVDRIRRGLFLLVRHWTRQAASDRRTIVWRRQNGEALLQALAASAIPTHVIGVFDDRNDGRSMPTVNGVRTSASSTTSSSSRARPASTS